MGSGKDPFLLGLDTKPSQNGVQKKEKIVKTPVQTEADPFMLGADVKKKDSPTGTEVVPTDSESGIENTSQELPSPLGYKRQIERKEVIPANKKQDLLKEPDSDVFGKSFLDRDIEKRFLLSDPSYNKPSDGLSLSNIFNQEAQQRFDQKVAYTKQDIKSSPEKLAAYTQTRIDELNTDIKAAKDNIKGVFEAQGYGAKIDPDIANNYERQLYDATREKNKLKSAVAVEAAKKFVPQYLAPNRPFDPKGLARDIVSIADPEQAFIFNEAQKNGSALPGITQANLEKTGIELSKQFLESQPQTDFVKQKLQEVNDYEKSFDERNFELTAQRAKEKIGVYFYEKGKSGFWGYSGKNIEKAINDPETGLTDAEKKIATEYVLPTENKLIFSTDIPGSGFFRAGKNAIDRSLLNTTNTIAGWIGERDDSKRASDLLNDEVQGSRFRAPGANPTWRSELNYLNNKETKEKLTEEEKARKVELDKYVDVRNGWSKFRDGVGDLTGQVVQIALLTKGIGVAGEALSAFGEGGGILGGLTTSAVGTALSNETAGLFLSSYLNSYDSYKTQSLQLMPGEKNAANRDAYAKVMAGVEGLSERIFNDTKVLKAFTKDVAPSVADITSRFINKELTQQAAREELQSALKKYLNPFRKEFVKSTFQESFEEGVVDIADGMAQSIFGGQDFDIVKTGQQAINTFLTTALYSPLVSGAAAHGHAMENRSQSAFVKSAIVDMANSPMDYLKSVEDLRLSGQITQPEANEKIKLINSAAQYLKEIPETIPVTKKKEGETTTENRQLDYPEISSYLVHRLNEGIINEQLENLDDEALRPVLEQKLKRSIEIRKGIIDNSIGVTPDIQEVTDNPKKAQDLGIVDANNVSPDELVGTPFKKEEVPQTKETPKDESETSEEAKQNVATSEKKYESKFPKPKVPISEMNSKQIREYGEEVRDYEKNQEKEFFGEEGAKKYKQAQRISNDRMASYDEKKAADKIINDMEASLSEEQRNDFFGIGYDDNGIYEPSEIKDLSRSVSFIEAAENVGDLARSLKLPLLSLSKTKSPSIENLTILNAARKRAAELGIPTEELVKKSLINITNDLSDRNDAEFLAQSVFEDLLKAGEPKTEQKELPTPHPEKPKVRVTAAEMKAAQPKPAKPEKVKSDRQEKINGLRDRVDSFNKMRANSKNKSSALNELRLDAEEMGLVIDYGKGHAFLKYEGGGKVQRRSSETNSKKANNFDPAKYSSVTQESVGKLIKDPSLITGLALKGEDGYRLSEAQKESAIESIKNGEPNNGAKAIYDFFENEENGNVLIEDIVTGQEVPVPIADYFSAVENVQPATDEDIEALNTLLGEEPFSDLFDEIYFNETTNENEQSTNETSEVEQPAKTDTGENKETDSGAERVAKSGEQSEEKTIADKGKVLADKIRSLKIKNDKLQSNIFGIGISLYNTSIDIVAHSIENGAKLADAIARGVEYIKTNHGESLNEEEYVKDIENHVLLDLKSKEDLSNYLNYIEDTYLNRHGVSRTSIRSKLTDFTHALDRSDLSDEELRDAVKKSRIFSEAKNKIYPKIADRGKRVAERIRQLKSPRDTFQANIFGIPIAIYDGVIETIATAVENGAKLAEAIQTGLKSLSKKDREVLDEEKFVQHINDIVAGKKPTVTTTGEIVEDKDVDKDDVKSIAKQIKEDKLKFKDAIEGKSEKFVDALNKELYGSKRFSMDEQAFRESIRKQKDFGLTKADIIAGLSSIKKLTQKQVNIIEDVFLESALTDKALQELNETFRNLAKGIKPKKVLARLANSDANALVSALNGALTYTSVSNKQQEDIADYIMAITDVNDIEDYLDKMSANNMADIKQILRAKAIIELQKNGNIGLAKQLVADMADDAVTAGRQTQSLKRVYQLLNAKGNAQIKTEFARKFAEKVQETALAMNKRMVDVLNGKEEEIKELNKKIHDKTQNSTGFFKKMQDLLDKICNTRRKK